MGRTRLSHYLCFTISLCISGTLYIPSVVAKNQDKSSIPKECVVWFKGANLNLDKDCSFKCSMIDTDMGTFDCTRFCDSFCKPTKIEKKPVESSFKISSLYPGLTDGERKFVEKNVQVAIKAYWLSWQADGICKEIYHVSDTNDESDACRHFIWAALLNSHPQIGTQLASELLDAHEQNADEPEEEKAMDLANNRRGLIASTELIKKKQSRDSDFLNQFLTDLKEGKLVVLKRRHP